MEIGPGLYNIYPKTERPPADQKWTSGECSMTVDHDYPIGGTIGGKSKMTIDIVDPKDKIVGSLSHRVVSDDTDYDVPDIVSLGSDPRWALLYTLIADHARRRWARTSPSRPLRGAMATNRSIRSAS